MKKRFKVKKHRSKKIFRDSVSRTHIRNVAGHPMRGGIRL